MAILDQATWLTGSGGTAVSGSRVVSEGGASTTVTGTFTANAWDASQSGNAVSGFGAFGVTSPITANYVFSNPVNNLTFTFDHVSSSGTTFDDLFTLYVYDDAGALIPAADVIASLTGVVDATISTNPDGSVSIEADNSIPEDITVNITGHSVSQVNVIFEAGPDGTQSGGAGISDFSFDIPPLDDIVEGTGGDDTIDASYVGDPEGDQIDALDSTGAETGNPGSNDDVVEAYGGNDVVNSGVGDDTIDAGTGNDTVTAGTGNDDVTLGDGDDDFGGFLTDDGNDTIDGGTGSDRINGGFGDDVLYGGDDNDTLIGGSDNDTMFGGAGSDTFLVTDDHETDLIFGGEDVGDTDTDLLSFINWESTQGVLVTATGDEAGTYSFYGTVGAGTYSEIESLSGTEFADTFNNAADNSGTEIFAQGGDDTVTTGTGDDSVDAGAGNDSVAAGVGSDTLDGGLGDDTLLGGDGHDSLLGGAGDDYLDGERSNDTIYGGAGDDTLLGGTALDYLDGGDDADSFIVENGFLNDTIVGGEGGNDVDTLDLSALSGADLTFSGNEAGTVDSGSNTLIFSEIEQIILTDQADTVDGSSDTVGRTLDARDGDDLVTTGSGADDILGGAGADTIVTGAGNDTVDGGDGDDRIYGGLGNDSLTGGTGSDDIYITEGEGTDTVVGGEDDPSNEKDCIVLEASGSQGATVLYTGAEAGTYSFDSGAGSGVFSEIEVAVTTQNDDLIDASMANSFVDIIARGGDDTIISSNTGAYIEAGTGADTITAGTGSEYINLGQNVAGTAPDGDADVVVLNNGFGYVELRQLDLPIANPDGTFTGVDTVDVSAVTDASGNPIHVTDISVVDDGSGNARLNFPNGEHIILQGVDPATASNPAWLNALGIPGNDVVSGTSGDDVIDTAYTGDGQGDMIDAGDSTGEVTGNPLSDDDYVLAAGGNDSVVAGAGDDTVLGQDGDDTILGGAGDDDLDGDDGLDGNDSILGQAGNDQLIGDGGDDYLDGGADNDTIFAGADDDTILGGDGDDQIYGQSGNDSITTGAGADTVHAGDDADTIFAGIGDNIDGGSGGLDADVLDLTGSAPVDGSLQVTITGPDSDGNGSDGFVEYFDNSGSSIGTLTFENIETIVACFTQDTLIKTTAGEVRAADIKLGDMVLTMDSGYQPVRWVGSRALDADDLAETPDLAPVRIAAGALGLNQPERDLLVSPQHRVLFSGPRCELLFADGEVLVPAVHLVGQPGITREEDAQAVRYIHFMFDRHELVQSDGVWSESFQPAQQTLSAFDAETCAELTALFPAMMASIVAGQPIFEGARMTLTRKESKLLVA